MTKTTKRTTQSAHLRATLPSFLGRGRQLLDLTEIAVGGPDPETLLPDVEELRRHCSRFLAVARGA
jgi:hypothetical protein